MNNPVRGGNEATEVVTVADLPRITGPAPGAPSTEAVGEVRRRVGQVLGDLDVDAIEDKWLRLCGACDAGMFSCNHPAEDYRPTMLRLVGEVRRLRLLVGAVELFGTGYQWRRSDGEVFVLHPAEVDVFVAADHVAESERLRTELGATIRERDAARAELLADAAAVADDDLHDCEVCEIATELAQERILHQQTIAERDQLRQHILDIDAHATPYGDIPEEPGWVGTYLLSAGALHRALGKIGHSAPKCTAEAHLETMREGLIAANAAADRYAVAGGQADAMLPVVEAAKAWREIDRYGGLSSNRSLAAAVDTYTNREADRGAS